MVSEDTIAALATTPGESAVGVIRLSGPQALAIADEVFRGHTKPSRARDRSVLHGEVVSEDGTSLDEVLLAVMRRPRSFTGEDVVEISCHGGMVAPRLILRRLIECGARLAEPGEFTRRAFLNGKIDLAQAEAVCDIVRAANEKAHRLALRQLKGGLSLRLARIERVLFERLIEVEAEIDFPEEEIDEANRHALMESLDAAGKQLRVLLGTEEKGRYLKNGLEVAIVGRANVGKSSLFNSLIGRERVIVSPLPGTTRDTVDARFNLNGFCLNLHDTAGLGGSDDLIEAEAVRRSLACLDSCDVALVVIDVSEPLSEADRDILREVTKKPHLVVANKIDLPARADLGLLKQPIKVSALRGDGLEVLLEHLKEMAREKIGGLEMDVAVSERHAQCIRQALEALERASQALEGGLSLELIAADLRLALDYIGEITGKKVTSEVLDEIFARFCIGK